MLREYTYCVCSFGSVWSPAQTRLQYLPTRVSRGDGTAVENTVADGEALNREGDGWDCVHVVTPGGVIARTLRANGAALDASILLLGKG
jgi:hypothetical protein